MLERLFLLRENGTNVRIELLAGLTTFMTMAYIVVVNPLVLAGAGGSGGPPISATVTATCLGAALPTLLMGLWARYPIALASGMGLNAAVAATIATTPGVTWQTMMGVVFVEGVIISVLVATGLREVVMHAIPADMKRAIAVGIGLLIAVIGFHNAHFMQSATGSGAPVALFPQGSFRQPGTVVALVGLAVTAPLLVARPKGALLLGIVTATVVAVLIGVAKPPTAIVGAPDFSTFGRLDVVGALRPTLLAVVFAFLITDFFDTMGTVLAVGEQSGHVRPDGSLPRLGRVLLVDSFAAAWGGLCSASSVTSYIESASGVAAGGRTGLTSVTVAVLFVISMFLAPLVQAVPGEATAAALIVVGILMMAAIRDVDLRDPATSIPVCLTILAMPFTMSISRSIGMGFLAYVLIRFLTGRWREVPAPMWPIAILFAIQFGLEAPPS